jgi:uncharacterized protein YndB with AHSA1/START domain
MKDRCIHFKAYYAEPIERVWNALTDPNSVKDWLTQANFKLKRGHRFRWKDPKSSQTSQKSPMEGALCEIQEVEAPCRLSYRVEQISGSTSIVTWHLKPLGEGTQVIIEQELIIEKALLVGDELKPHPSAISMAFYLKTRTLIQLKMELEQNLLTEMEIAA